MPSLKIPNLPEGNLYDQLKDMSGDPDAQAVVRAVQATLDHFRVHASAWDVVGNVLVRYGAVVLLNRNFPVDPNDQKAVNLKKMGDVFLQNMGDDPPLRKFIIQPGAK